MTTMQQYSRPLRRTEVRIVADAIGQFLADAPDTEWSYDVDGYCVLVSVGERPPSGQYDIGLYEPGSTPVGTCDWYGRCTADGETVETDS